MHVNGWFYAKGFIRTYCIQTPLPKALDSILAQTCRDFESAFVDTISPMPSNEVFK